MLKRLFSSQLRINMLSGTLTTVINGVVMIIGYPLFLHFLGYEKYGVWLVLATVLTFAQLGDLGIGPAITKLVAEEYGRNNIKGVQRYTATALAMLCVSGIVILSAILIFKTQITSLFNLNDENTKTVLYLLPYVGILSVYVFMVLALNSVLSGLGRMDLANYIQSAGRAVIVIVAAILLYNGRGIESLLIGYASSYLLIHVASLIYIRRIAGIRIMRIDNIDIRSGKVIIGFGSAVLGSSIINMLFDPFNKLMLSRYAGVSAIPIYDIAYRGGKQIRALIETGFRALMPEISRIGANMTVDARKRISHLNRRAVKLIVLLGGPLYAGLIILLTPLLKLWLREQFVSELPLSFRIMLVCTFISLFAVPAYYTLLGLGKVKHTLTYQFILSILNAAILLFLVFILKTNLSVEKVFAAIFIATTVGTFYLIYQNRKNVLQ